MKRILKFRGCHFIYDSLNAKKDLSIDLFFLLFIHIFCLIPATKNFFFDYSSSTLYLEMFSTGKWGINSKFWLVYLKILKHVFDIHWIHENMLEIFQGNKKHSFMSCLNMFLKIKFEDISSEKIEWVKKAY